MRTHPRYLVQTPCFSRTPKNWNNYVCLHNLFYRNSLEPLKLLRQMHPSKTNSYNWPINTFGAVRLPQTHAVLICEMHLLKHLHLKQQGVLVTYTDLGSGDDKKLTTNQNDKHISYLCWSSVRHNKLLSCDTFLVAAKARLFQTVS